MTRRWLAISFCTLFCLSACSDDATPTKKDGTVTKNDGGSDGNPDPCAGTAGHEKPDCHLLDPVKEPTIENGTADFTCVGSAPQPKQPTKDLIVRGKTKQRLSNGSDEDKGEVSVEVWTDQTSLSAATLIAKTKSDATGNYEIKIPKDAWAKATSSGARVAWRITSNDTVPTVEFNDFLDDKLFKAEGNDLAIEDQERITITRATQQVITSLLGVRFDDKKGLILGAIRDCNRKDVGEASAGIVDASGKTVVGPLFFYFFSDFPVRRDQPCCRFSTTDGLFVAINVDPGKADTRIVAKVGGKTTVVSQFSVPVAADTIAIVDFDPLEKPLSK